MSEEKLKTGIGIDWANGPSRTVVRTLDHKVAQAVTDFQDALLSAIMASTGLPKHTFEGRESGAKPVPPPMPSQSYLKYVWEYDAENGTPNLEYGAPSAGTAYDIDAMFSGKSAATSKAAAKEPTIKVIQDGLPSAASTAHAQAVKMEPQPRCPSCGAVVLELDGAVEQYPVPTGVDISACQPVFTKDSRMLFQLHPCGCRINQEWAAAYTQEIQRRIAGGHPLPIIDMTAEQREKTKVQLDHEILTLYQMLDAAKASGDKAQIENYEYYLIIATDKLMRLIPGAWNRLKPVDISDKVTKWAEKNGLKTPPKTEEGNAKEAAMFNTYKSQFFPNGLGKPQVVNSGSYTDVYLPDGNNYRFWTFDAASTFAGEYMQKQCEIAESLALSKAVPLSISEVGSLMERYAAAGHAVSTQPIRHADPSGQMVDPATYVPKPKKPIPGLQTLPKGPPPANWLPTKNPNEPSSVLAAEIAAANLSERLAHYFTQCLKRGQKEKANVRDFALTDDAFEGLTSVETVHLADLIAESLLDSHLKEMPEYLGQVRQANAFFHAMLLPRIDLAKHGHKPSPQSKEKMAEAAKIIADHEKMVYQVTAAMREAKKRTHFALSMVQNSIIQDRNFAATREVLNEIHQNLEQYLAADEPLTENAARFVALFLQSTDQEYINRLNDLPPATPTAGPKPAPVIPEVSLPPEIRKAMQANHAAEITKAKKMQFYSRLGRTKRVIRLPKGYKKPEEIPEE